jgi:thiamine pyrophosphokinase
VTALVLAGGDPPTAAVIERLPAADLVVAADSGLDHAEALGIRVDVVVGDLDSVTDAALGRARDAGTPVTEHPRDKDATDLDLALLAAVDRGATHLVVVGGTGGRLDHLLGNLLLLGAPAFAGCTVELHAGPARVHVVRGGTACTIAAAPGELVSLMALHGPVRGVTTDGLRWTLAGDTLDPGSTRGISNEVVAPPVTVALDAGTLVVVLPGTAPDAGTGAR